MFVFPIVKHNIGAISFWQSLQFFNNCFLYFVPNWKQLMAGPCLLCIHGYSECQKAGDFHNGQAYTSLSPVKNTNFFSLYYRNTLTRTKFSTRAWVGGLDEAACWVIMTRNQWDKIICSRPFILVSAHEILCFLYFDNIHNWSFFLISETRCLLRF